MSPTDRRTSPRRHNRRTPHLMTRAATPMTLPENSRTLVFTKQSSSSNRVASRWPTMRTKQRNQIRTSTQAIIVHSPAAPWQLHSGFGPNVNPEARIMHFSPLEAVVNPPDFNYSENEYKVSLDDARTAWEVLRETANQYTDASLSRDQLGDDFQQLFLQIASAHVRALIDAKKSSSMLPVKPLRLLLLGTAGTGKTTTVQTTLQEINNVLAQHGLPGTFYRMAAPTGCAAFNLRFNATTVHLLIHYFSLNACRRLSQTRALFSSTRSVC